jgi:hypothetical protein
MNAFDFRGIAAFSALVAFGLLGNPGSALAQDTQGGKTPVGSWLYTVTIPMDQNPANNVVFQGVETYIPGGGYIETDQLSFSPSFGLSTPSHGAWANTSHSEFAMTYLNFSYDKTGASQGMGKVRQLATLSADGLSYKGGGDFVYLDPKGNIVLAGTFTVIATRIQAQAPSQFTDGAPIAQHLKSFGEFRRVTP